MASLKLLICLCLFSALSVLVSASDFGSGQYLGCYEDRGQRDLEHFKELGTGNTPQACVNYCGFRGYKYAGVQYKTQCFCSNTYGRYGKKSGCNTSCHNGKDNCGGTWRNSVYRTNYLGCFKDQPSRALATFLLMPSQLALPEYCVSLCRNRGYKLAGAQYHDQCFCGNDPNRYGEVPQSECRATCKGDRSMYCGGTWRNAVYWT